MMMVVAEEGGGGGLHVACRFYEMPMSHSLSYIYCHVARAQSQGMVKIKLFK